MLSIESGVLVQVLIGFGVILILIFLLTWIMKKLNLVSARIARQGEDPRLSIKEVIAVDHKRRLLLVRRDNVEHLLLIGGETDILVEHHIPSQQPQLHPAPAPMQAPAHPPMSAQPTPALQNPTGSPMRTPAPTPAAPSAPQVKPSQPTMPPMPPRQQERQPEPQPRAPMPQAHQSRSGAEMGNLDQAKSGTPDMRSPRGPAYPQGAQRPPMGPAMTRAMTPPAPQPQRSSAPQAPQSFASQTQKGPIYGGSSATADRAPKPATPVTEGPKGPAMHMHSQQSKQEAAGSDEDKSAKRPEAKPTPDQTGADQAKQKPAASEIDEPVKQNAASDTQAEKPQNYPVTSPSSNDRPVDDRPAPGGRPRPRRQPEAQSTNRAPDKASDQTSVQASVPAQVRTDKPADQEQPEVREGKTAVPTHESQTPLPAAEQAGTHEGTTEQASEPTKISPEADSSVSTENAPSPRPSEQVEEPAKSVRESQEAPEVKPLSQSASYDDEINRLLNELSNEIKK